MYKRITHITLLFAMAFNSTSALAETKYFANRTETTDNLGNIIYVYKEPIIPRLASIFIKFNKTVYSVNSDDIISKGNSYTQVNIGAVNPIPPPVHPGGPAAIIPDQTAVNTDPLTAAPSLKDKELQILSELSQVNVASLAPEDYSPEQIESLSAAINKFYSTTLGKVTSPEKAVEISHIATKNDIDLNNYYNPNNIDSSNDEHVKNLTLKEQSRLYLATIHDIEKRDDKAEGYPELVAKEGALDQSINRLEVYEELIQIATDTTNSRIMELVATDISSPIITSSSALPGTRDYTGVSAGNKEHNLNSVWMRGTHGGVRQGKN
ncbi:MAG: hypothetical protein NWP47_04110 [Rickettsiaceae bacterium]|nr:hypothetical protein [Rickettsiaceae bacterium]